MKKSLTRNVTAIICLLVAQLATGVSIVERGPLELTGANKVQSASAYRIETFGNARLTLTFHGTFILEGPVTNFGDDVAPGTGPVAARGNGKLNVFLKAPGIYRVLPDSAGSFTAVCSTGCRHIEISTAAFLSRLASDKAELLLSKVTPLLEKMAPYPALLAEWKAIVAGRRWEALDRFPILPPLPELGELRPLLGGNAQAPAHAPLNAIHGDLAALLSAAKPDRGYRPAPFMADFPEVGYGHFNCNALTKAQLAHSPVIAQVLTALAANNGSSIEVAKHRVTDAGGLFAALIASGHTIEVRNERTYANFISLTYRDVYVRWPVWMDTGLKLPNGETLVVPSGHSQHAWRISGPIVNARVAFFLGIHGVGFFPSVDERPEWTGMNVRDITRSGNAAGDKLIVKTVQVAAAYYRRIQSEVLTVARGKRADGYGYLGICNDSNAAIELATRGTISAFPLMRAEALSTLSRIDDGLDPIFERLPHDADVPMAALESGPYHHDALCRNLAMIPRPVGAVRDARFQAQYELLLKAVGKTCAFTRGR